MKLLLTLLALLTGLSAAPAQARVGAAERADVERVENSTHGAARAPAAAVSEVGARAAPREWRHGKAARLQPAGPAVLVPSIRHGDRARE